MATFNYTLNSVSGSAPANTRYNANQTGVDFTSDETPTIACATIASTVTAFYVSSASNINYSYANTNNFLDQVSYDQSVGVSTYDTIYIDDVGSSGAWSITIVSGVPTDYGGGQFVLDSPSYSKTISGTITLSYVAPSITGVTLGSLSVLADNVSVASFTGTNGSATYGTDFYIGHCATNQTAADITNWALISSGPSFTLTQARGTTRRYYLTHKVGSDYTTYASTNYVDKTVGYLAPDTSITTLTYPSTIGDVSGFNITINPGTDTTATVSEFRVHPTSTSNGHIASRVGSGSITVPSSLSNGSSQDYVLSSALATQYGGNYTQSDVTTNGSFTVTASFTPEPPNVDYGLEVYKNNYTVFSTNKRYTNWVVSGTVTNLGAGQISSSISVTDIGVYPNEFKILLFQGGTDNYAQCSVYQITSNGFTIENTSQSSATVGYLVVRR